MPYWYGDTMLYYLMHFSRRSWWHALFICTMMFLTPCTSLSSILWKAFQNWLAYFCICWRGFISYAISPTFDSWDFADMMPCHCRYRHESFPFFYIYFSIRLFWWMRWRPAPWKASFHRRGFHRSRWLLNIYDDAALLASPFFDESDIYIASPSRRRQCLFTERWLMLSRLTLS